VSKKSTVDDAPEMTTDNQNSEAATDAVMAESGGELEKLQQERDNYLTLLRQTKADFDNYQKRAAREAETERKFAQRSLALEIIPALDNLDRFLASVKEETELTKVVSMVQKQLLDGLARQGVKRIESEGQAFDPNRHEAIMQQPSDQPAGTVLMEVEAGYLYHDRVLRPAKVIVAKGQS
jgi:molecular chaperone GrpE